MKHIKRIDELKSDTYKQAGEKLLRYGHSTRGQKLASYGSIIRAEEIRKEIADAEANLESDIIKLENELKNKSLCSNAFKLKVNIPPTQPEKIPGGYNFKTNTSISSDTNFYLMDFDCPQLWDGIGEYLNADWFGIEFLPHFSFVDVVEKELEPNPMWPNEGKKFIKMAKIRDFEPFRVGVSLKSEICAYADDFLNMSPKEIEDQLYGRANSFISETYNDFINRDAKHPLTNRQDARLLLNEIKKTFSDNGKIFKNVYKMFRDQQGEEFDYHAVLSAFQRAVMSKISINLLYSE